MTKLDPIIAVKDIKESAKWYKEIFGLRNTHGGDSFAVLTSEINEVILCLHKWGEHNHPTLTNPNIETGNGLLLYFRTKNRALIKQNLDKIDWKIEEEVHENSNSLRKEFSFKDPDGYFWIVTDYHKYEG